MGSAKVTVREEGGFVLVLALIAVLGLSLIAVDLGRRSSEFAEIASVESGLIEAGFAADAGLAVALAALSDETDLHAARSMASDEGLQWHFDRATIRIRIQSESGKVDLMAGELELIRGVVGALVADETMRGEILRRVEDVRRSQIPPRTIAAILPPSLRVTSLASRLSACLTVFSGQAGIDPISATPLVRKLMIAERADLVMAMAQSVRTGRIAPDLAAGLGSRLIGQRPLYTIAIEARLPNGVVSRRAVLARVTHGRDAEILRRLDPGPDGPDAADRPSQASP
jgi:hypothetical protein